jgi:benzodiazapine receptor
MVLTHMSLWFALTIAGAVAWVPLLAAPSTKEIKWYNDSVSKAHGAKRKRMFWWAPPGWVFGLAWFILFGLIIAATIIYATGAAALGDGFVDRCCATVPTVPYVAILALIFVNISLNHLWTALFFRRRMGAIALIDCILVWATAVTVLALLGWQGAWLAFGLWAPYPVWCTFAVFFNSCWLAWAANPLEGEKAAIRKAT